VHLYLFTPEGGGHKPSTRQPKPSQDSGKRRVRTARGLPRLWLAVEIDEKSAAVPCAHALAFHGIVQGLAGLYDQNLWLLRVKLRRTLHTVFMPYVVDGALGLSTFCRFSQDAREANRTSFERDQKKGLEDRL
jgi:hypothetical protein